MSREELANQIWRACDIMRRDDNTKLILKYVEHLSWLLFLKVFEAIEDRHGTEAEIAGRPYERVLEGEYRWSEWTSIDWRGQDLIEFVQGKLLPHLRDLRGSPEREIVATVFGGITTVMKSPYNLKDVIAIVDEIDFHRTEDVHTISLVYESLLAKMGSEAGLSGEFYTPRPIIRFMVQVVDPRIGESVYDPACGSAGFLVETYLYMKKAERTTKDHEILQHRTFFGQESGELPFLLGTMNMVLHGVLRPTIVRRNTLEENIRNIPDSERHHIVLTNPPFGGKESRQIQQNFPAQSQATELLFLQHVLKKLKVHARCGIVLPEGVLFRGDAFARVKKELLENFNLHTVVSLPGGVFLPYSGVKTNLLFFERTGPTREIWYYEVQPPNGGRFTKGNPIQDEHLADALDKRKERSISELSWVEPVEAIVDRGYDLTAKNPHRPQDAEQRSPQEIVTSILEEEREIASIVEEIGELLSKNYEQG